jgi:hypothetical protein
MSARIFSRHVTAAAALPTVEEIAAELAEVPDGAPRVPGRKR